MVLPLAASPQMGHFGKCCNPTGEIDSRFLRRVFVWEACLCVDEWSSVCFGELSLFQSFCVSYVYYCKGKIGRR